MLDSLNVDKRALKLLSKYDILAESYKRQTSPLTSQQISYVEEHGTSAENLQYMKEKGLAFDCLHIEHDQAVKACFEFKAICKKRHITDLFLSSFTSRKLHHRSGLSAYA